LVLFGRHQDAVTTEEINLLADADIVVSFLANVVVPFAVVGFPPEVFLHCPRPRERIVDRRNFVVKQLLVCFIAIHM
jgi:hypothetical protein